MSREGLKVKYPSGYERRLDTAVRQNVLDGARAVNMGSMRILGEQFGADGVEIDAHGLCADDHLPYQGRQYTIKEFDDIQGSLERPFGQWNCRHNIHYIVLGISPPATTPEELEAMNESSTEKITIDGVTKTRYEWSQAMRRLETEARYQNDETEAFKAYGDREAAKESDRKAAEIVDAYDRVCRATGLEPRYDRMYVGRASSVLTRNTTADIMASDSSQDWFPITPESIRSVPDFTEFGSFEANASVHRACVEILTDLVDKPVGTEETISIRLSDLKPEKGGQGDGVVKIVRYDTPYIAIHNHPSNETFSYQDLELFECENNCIGLVVVGNNGRNTYTILKTEQFDAVAYTKYRVLRKYGYVRFDSEEEYMKGAEKYGVRYIKRRR